MRHGFLREHLLLFVTCIALTLILDNAAALAFDIAGHFYTVLFVAQGTLPYRQKPRPYSTDEVTLIAFCAQLPDESHELDAVSAWVDCGNSFSRRGFFHTAQFWAYWQALGSIVNVTPSRGVQRLVALHQLLHGLTGAKSGREVTNTATTIASDLLQALDRQQSRSSDDLCALGFALLK